MDYHPSPQNPRLPHSVRRVEPVKAAFINDVWLVRRLPKLLQSFGFDVLSTCSHGYLQTCQPDYMLTLVGPWRPDTLAANVHGGETLANALKAEARRRAQANEFFAFISFVSCIARKPGQHADVRCSFRALRRPR